jgi:urease beta subunit
MSGSTSRYIIAADPVEINAGRPTREISVWNTGDRAIQVGSHFHFFEVNRALRFDRNAAYGTRLDIPAGTAVRFEPGDRKDVVVVAIGGNRVVVGLNDLTNGELDDPEVRRRAMDAMTRRGFAQAPSGSANGGEE